MEPSVREENGGYTAYLGGVAVGTSDSETHALAIAEAAKEYWREYQSLRGFDPKGVPKPPAP